MKDRKLATRYARALLSSLQDFAILEQVDRFLTGIGEALESAPDLREALEDPATSRAERIRVLKAIARDYDMPDRVDAFLETVVENGRVAQLGAIAEVFHGLREEALGIVPATLTTARRLDSDQEGRARQALEHLTGKRIRLTCSVEPSLIGGAVTQIGSTVYDGSLRTQLASLRRRMIQE